MDPSGHRGRTKHEKKVRHFYDDILFYNFVLLKFVVIIVTMYLGPKFLRKSA